VAQAISLRWPGAKLHVSNSEQVCPYNIEHGDWQADQQTLRIHNPLS
jgi:hypothetical protein